MSKITESANGEECQIRIPGVCCFDSATTVWCHANGLASGRGKGLKSPDILGAYGCYKCHQVVDSMVKLPGHLTRQDVEICFHEGHQRSLRILIEKGLVWMK